MEIHGVLQYFNRCKRTAFVKVSFLYLFFLYVVVRHRVHKAVKDNEGIRRNYSVLVTLLIV